MQKRTVVGHAPLVLWVALLLVVLAGAVLVGCATRPKEAVAGPLIDGAEAYHVIVAGGDPEGVAAALAAARNGMKTLLVEKDEALGGLMTLGMLNFLDMNHGPRDELLTRGIFEEFYKALGNAFDVEEAKTWFLKKCQDEPNLTVWLDTEILAPIMDGNQILGLRIRRGGQEEDVRALVVIDATVDADVAAAAGVPYTVGGEDYGAYGTLQGVTLVFEVTGVDWQGITRYLKNDGNASTDANAVAAWGYGTEAQQYQPTDENMRFRGPNIARQKNGNVLLNALIIFGVDALDPVSYQQGIDRGRAEIPHIITFMQEAFPGFENAAFVDTAPRLYVRETRHILGEYRLTITDVMENRDHWDRIGHGSYPVDIQPTSPGNFGNVIGAPHIYSIPFRCLVPQVVDGLLVVGRSASYDSIPHGSARVIPIGMVAGEAAGTAAAYAVNEAVSFRQMSADVDAIDWLQTQLKKQGAYLVEYTPPRFAVMDHWAYPGVVVMREMGQTEGGYANDYRLENLLPNRWALQNKFNKLMSLAHTRTADRGAGQIPLYEISLPDDEILVSKLLIESAKGASIGDADWIARQEGVTPRSFADGIEAAEYLMDLGVLDASVIGYYQDMDMVADYAQLLYVLGSLYTVLMEM